MLVAPNGDSKRYQELVQGLPVAVYMCDARGFITLYNEAAVELWGRRPEPGKEKWCGSLRIYNPDGSPLALDECPMSMTLRQGKAVVGAGDYRRAPRRPAAMGDASSAAAA